MKLSEWLLPVRGTLRFAAFHGLVNVVAHLGYRLPSAKVERFGLYREPNIVYGPTRSQDHRLDVYVPTGTPGPHPVVMYVHGGGFASLSKDTHRLMAIQIAKKGYVVFNINYRQGFRHPFPEPLEDAATALLWVNANAHRYGGDASRLALAGESAGGNLVCALGLLHGVRRPERFARAIYSASLSLRAVICTYPYADLRDITRFSEHPRLSPLHVGMLEEARRSYLGRGGRRRSMDLASPLAILESHADAHRIPPFFVSCGTRDPLFPDSKRLKAALDRLGVPCELHVAPGEIHGFDAFLWRAAARSKWRAAHRFLEAHLAAPPQGSAGSREAPLDGRQAS